jgi:hypothetical protein
MTPPPLSLSLSFKTTRGVKWLTRTKKRYFFVAVPVAGQELEHSLASAGVAEGRAERVVNREVEDPVPAREDGCKKKGTRKREREGKVRQEQRFRNRRKKTNSLI